MKYFNGTDIGSNVYGYTEGLLETYGESRVIDTPISEAAIVGTAVGSSLCGIKPVLDLTVASFLYVAMDQIVSIASKMRYMHNGRQNAPITILVWMLYGTSSASQHSDRPMPMIINSPGIKSVAPACPQDAYSLIKSSIEDPDPVIVFLDRNLFYQQGVVDKEVKIKLGEPRIVTSGTDVTVLSVSGALQSSLKAVQALSEKDNQCVDRHKINSPLFCIRVN